MNLPARTALIAGLFATTIVLSVGCTSPAPPTPLPVPAGLVTIDTTPQRGYGNGQAIAEAQATIGCAVKVYATNPTAAAVREWYATTVSASAAHATVDAFQGGGQALAIGQPIYFTVIGAPSGSHTVTLSFDGVIYPVSFTVPAGC